MVGRRHAPRVRARRRRAGKACNDVAPSLVHRRGAGHLQPRRLDRQLAWSLALDLGDYLDIRGQQATRPALYAADSHAASQAFGEAVRASGGAGLLYDSLRHAGGVNVVAHRPRNVLDVTQADHFEIAALAASRRITMRRLASAP